MHYACSDDNHASRRGCMEVPLQGTTSLDVRRCGKVWHVRMVRPRTHVSSFRPWIPTFS